MASRRADFPTVIGAFDAGELTLEQVAVLVKAPAWADADILQWGKIATVSRRSRCRWRLPEHVRDQLLCNGAIQPVWERDGLPFSVGRTQRIVPERTRRIISYRDEGCRVPGCTNDRFVEIHHIVHWLDGGPTDTPNLISLCPKHHRLHHQGRLGITGDAVDDLGVTFTDWNGRVIDPAGRPRPPTGELPRPAAGYQPPLAGRVDYDYVGGSWIHPNELRRRARAADERCRTNRQRPTSE